MIVKNNSCFLMSSYLMLSFIFPDMYFPKKTYHVLNLYHPLKTRDQKNSGVLGICCIDLALLQKMVFSCLFTLMSPTLSSKKAVFQLIEFLILNAASFQKRGCQQKISVYTISLYCYTYYYFVFCNSIKNC